MTHPARSTQALIDELVRSAGCRDASEAIRAKASELIDLHVASFEACKETQFLRCPDVVLRTVKETV